MATHTNCENCMHKPMVICHRLIGSALTHLYLKYFDLMPKLEFVAVGEQSLHAMGDIDAVS